MLDNLTNKKINQTLSDFQQKYSFILISLEQEHKELKEKFKETDRDWRHINFTFQNYKAEQRKIEYLISSRLKQIEKISDEAQMNLQFISQFDRKTTALQISIENEQKKLQTTINRIEKNLKKIDSETSIQIRNVRNEMNGELKNLRLENKSLTNKISRGRKMSNINLFLTLISFLIIVSYLVYEKF
ncbi:hypothetical protein [Mesonia mobilis]|uniref:hypothetical protein n=1 Tax=Mesonia mobilis TaxID=369791 RepID=UPI0026ECBF18|nr:hypothetical protein [Mesonia mobilis]